MENRTYLCAALLLLSCSDSPEPGGGSGSSSILGLEATEVPGVFAVTGSEGPFTFDCNEGSQGQALVVNGQWLSSRDLPDLQGECRLLAEGIEARLQCE